VSRLAWSGGETGSIAGDGPEFVSQLAAPALDTAVVHGGVYAYKATGSSQQMRALLTPVDGRWYFARCWYRFDALPSADMPIMRWYGNSNGTPIVAVVLQPDGQLAYVAAGTNAAVQTLTPVIANTWFCVEYGLRARVGAVGGYDSIFRHDGVTLSTYSSSRSAAASGVPDAVRLGHLGTASAAP
jgi:hypothetical protein